MKYYKHFIITILFTLMVIQFSFAQSSAVALTLNNAKYLLGEDYEGKIEIIIPKNVVAIDDNVFKGCKFLETVKISDGVKTIGNSAFYGCKSLESITIPSSVKTIGENAFSGCESLKKITIPNGMKLIGDRAFKNCKSLTEIKIPDDVELGNDVFAFCSNLTMAEIGKVNNLYYTFQDCENLKEVKITNGPTSLSGTFYNCNLTDITIPNSVTEINSETFAGCDNLTSITIPRSVKKISTGAFCDWEGDMFCDNLKNVTFEDQSGWMLETDSRKRKIPFNVSNSETNAVNMVKIYRRDRTSLLIKE